VKICMGAQSPINAFSTINFQTLNWVLQASGGLSSFVINVCVHLFLSICKCMVQYCYFWNFIETLFNTTLKLKLQTQLLFKNQNHLYDFRVKIQFHFWSSWVLKLIFHNLDPKNIVPLFVSLKALNLAKGDDFSTRML
jgi:hypothetical protein